MILAVAGGKGGVGKSTVALNLAAELDAVVVDADLGMADLPGGRGPDLHDVLAGRTDPVEAVRNTGSVRVLPCGRSLAGAREADVTGLVAALRAVDQAYGRVVVDSPAGLAADAGVPLLAADACVLVVGPEAFALADAVRTRALAVELRAAIDRVAYNRVDPGVPTVPVERALGAPVTAIPEADVVRRAQSAGVPVGEIAAESAVAERFRSLAGSLYSVRS